MRSGTLDTPAIVGLRGRRRGWRSKAQRERAEQLAALRDELVARRAPRPSRTPCSTATRPRVEHRLPGNAHFSFPGCEGDALLMLLDARGIECSTGSACSAGVPQPSHVLLAMGVPEDAARGSLRFSLGHTSTAADVDAVRRGDRARSSSGPGRPGRQPHGKASTMRVLAAMSGGVDSAVAAARAVEAGHDVTGVHLALSSNPQSFRTGARGCCTLEDARDARRAADVLGIPFYVWDLAERFRAGRRRRLRRRVRRRPHARTRACAATRRSSSPRCSTRRSRSASTPSCTGHYARVVDGRLHRAVDEGKDQSYVLGVLTAAQVGARDVPARRHRARRDVRARGRDARARGRRQAGQPRHLLHRRRRHRGLPARPARRRARRDRRHRRQVGRRARRRVRASPSGSARGCASAGRARTGGPATCSTSRR